MVDLTAIRDADLLDLSLLRTVREVCASEELSLLRIAPDSDSIAETRAQRDALTGLRNRKTFDDVILRLFAGGADSAAEQGVWLGIVDIDHFKRVNDTFGHLYGDEVLLLVAQLMQRAFRQDDLLFRFGGEEFVIVLRGLDRDTAVHLFERFRLAVAEHLFPQVGQVTLSTGIVELTHGRLISEMLDEADKALYLGQAARPQSRGGLCRADCRRALAAGCAPGRQRRSVLGGSAR